MKQQLLILRRNLLALLPEWIWPRTLTLDGVNLPLRGMPWSFGTKWLLKKGGYEAEERALLACILQPGMQVLEMGSSIGILTAITAKKVGPSGRVVAVEASARLTRHSAPWLTGRYPWVSVVTGFGFPVGQAPALHIQGFDEARGNLGGTVQFSATAPPAAPAAQPAVYDIGTLCAQYSLQPQLLLIDVEGSERILLETTPRLPASVQHIVMELHPGLFPNGRADSTAIQQALASEGFRLQQEIRGVFWWERVGLG